MRVGSYLRKPPLARDSGCRGSLGVALPLSQCAPVRHQVLIRASLQSSVVLRKPIGIHTFLRGVKSR